MTMSSKKYDIEEEAHKLFGTSIPDVIQMFRMSPDYQQILDENVKDIKKELRLVSLQVLCVVLTNITNSITFQQDLSDDSVLKPPKVSSESTSGSTSNESDVQILEKYPGFNTKLSITERNRLKEHGFELAEKVIEIIINQMDSEVDKNVKTTTTVQEQRGTTAIMDDRHEINLWSTQPPGHDNTPGAFLRTGNVHFLDSARLRADDNVASDNEVSSSITPLQSDAEPSSAPSVASSSEPPSVGTTAEVQPETDIKDTVEASETTALPAEPTPGRRSFRKKYSSVSAHTWIKWIQTKSWGRRRGRYSSDNY